LNENEKTENAERAKQQKEIYKQQQETIEQEYDLRLSEIDLLRATEDEKTKLRLEAERDRMKKLLAMAEAGQTEMSEFEIKTLKNNIALVNKEIEKASKAGNKDIFDLVGLKLDNDEKQAITDTVGFSIEKLKEILDAQVEIKEKALQAAQEETDAAKSRLDAEIEARNNGYANNVATVQKELQLAKDKEEKALAEKQKAQRASQALDTLMQTSSLITASAEIWKSLAGVPIVGIPLAIAGIATMWGSFAASKVKAREATQAEYGEGGLEFLEGGSHASGNDIDLHTTNSEGKNMRAEGGEALAIINRRNTRKYRRMLPGIIQSLNNGTFEAEYLSRFSGTAPLLQVSSTTDLRKLERDVTEIKKQNSVRYYTMGDGTTVMLKGNVKTIIR
jgi:hypothetical protein